MNQAELNFIDYSQYSAFFKCSWQWHERYVARRVKKWPTDRQRDDNLCIGSLVHDGLENWYTTGKIFVDEEAILENNPTPEAMALVSMMLSGYVRRYPSVPWQTVRVEMPITRPLTPDVTLLAKVDQYFFVPELLEIESGIPGETLTLTPGYWVEEHKTKGMTVDRARWMRTWVNNMQASFQCLALKEHLGDVPMGVQGVLVNVLEKPTEYVPRRKCKGCSMQFELASYLPHPEGSACPSCGHVQTMKPYESKVDRSPNYFRMITTRSQDQLDRDLVEIALVSEQMERMKVAGKYVVAPNRGNCVDTRFGPCDYADNHTIGGLDVEDDDSMELKHTTKYVSLELVGT